MWLIDVIRRLLGLRAARRGARNSGARNRTVLRGETLEGREVPSGTWTKLANLPPGMAGVSNMALLSDGDVMVHGGGTTSTDIITSQWARLSPDSAGDYFDGTFATTGSMSVARTAFPSNLLPSGKLLVVGGEYTTPSGATSSGEVYDPDTGVWAPIQSFPLGDFGDQSTALLPSGQILAGSGPNPLSGDETKTFLYDPALDSWTRTFGNKSNSDSSTEENWVLLPGGSVLSYDLNSGTSTINGQTYDPSTGTWTEVNDIWGVPSLQDSRSRGEIGGPIRLLDGSIFWPGANGLTALYEPSVFYNPPNNTDPVPWSAGPTMPVDLSDKVYPYNSDDGQLTGTDTPSAILPNGQVLLALGSRGSNSDLPIYRTHICEFDPVANTIVEQTYGTQGATIPTDLQTQLDVSFCEDVYFLDLPNGHVLLSTTFSPQVWEYSPDGGVSNQAQLPTVSTVFRNADGTYTLTGTYLTGDSEGASDGDNAEMSTNFPIVKLTDGSGNAWYCKTYGWMPGVADGALRSTQFALPSGLPSGNYSLQVCASGLVSAAASFNTPYYADTHWAGMTIGTPVADADPIAPGNQPGVVGTNAFATVSAAVAAATSAASTYNTTGTVVVNGYDGTSGGTFNEAVSIDNLTQPLTVHLQQGAVTFNSLAGNSASAVISLNGVGLTVGDGNATEFDGQITGTGSLIKIGTGTLTLGGANAYSGTTTVDSGTLSVTGSLSGRGAVTVASAATLRGTGSVNGAVAVNGTLQAGTAGMIGRLTINNSLTFSSIGTLAVRINNTNNVVTYDQVAVTSGTVSLNGATLSVDLNYTPDYGDRFEIIDATGANAVQGSFGFVEENFEYLYNDSGHNVYLVWIFGGD